MNSRLKIAIQKSGRLAEKSISTLTKCGLDFDLRKNRLIHECQDYPIDLMLVRDDDIPEYVADGVCHLGIVGENVIEEKFRSDPDKDPDLLHTLIRLGFGNCRLSIAVPEGTSFSDPSDLNHLRIATSYPSCLKRFLVRNGITANIVKLSGSVEIATTLGIADAICDLVSTGATLKSHGLKEVLSILESQAVIIKTGKMLSLQQKQDVNRLIQKLVLPVERVTA